MSAEVPPDGLSERQLLKWFADAPKRQKEKELKEKQEWEAQKATQKKKEDQKRRRAKLKEAKKQNKRKAAERKRNAKKRKRDREIKEKEERKKNRKPGGFATTEYKISPALRACCGGAAQLSRPQATKQIWAYIKANNLQNPANKREIICDDKLLKVFDNNKKIGMMQVAKFLGAHFIGDPISTTTRTSSSSKGKVPVAKARRMEESEDESSSEEDSSSEEELDDEDGPSNSKLRKAIHAYLKATDLSSVTNKTVRKYLEKQFDCELKERKAFLKKEVQIFLETEINSKNKNKGGLNKEMKLSDDLSAVCAGATKLSRSQVVKALWIYIKANNLQNPKNKREIICDKKFKKVMDGNDKVTMFSMNKYIGAHLSD
jgi:upstream activation factor subunit UAF30